MSLRNAIEKAFEGREYSVHSTQDDQAVERINRDGKSHIILGNHGLILEWLDASPMPTMEEALSAIQANMEMQD